jgi:hypothetical protein
MYGIAHSKELRLGMARFDIGFVNGIAPGYFLIDTSKASYAQEIF